MKYFKVLIDMRREKSHVKFNQVEIFDEEVSEEAIREKFNKLKIISVTEISKEEYDKAHVELEEEKV